MKRYRQPKAGTYDPKVTVKSQGKPLYKWIQDNQELDKKTYRGNTDNEWQ